MGQKYITITGDTFSSISLKKFGTEAESGRIASANPGAFEPLVAGLSLTIPSSPNTPPNSPQVGTATGVDEVTITIDGVRLRYWGTISINRALDSIDSLTLTAPFEPDQEEFRKIFKPLSYQSIEVKISGVPYFTGTLIGVTPSTSAKGRVVSIQAYSTPGVLNDCSVKSTEYNTLDIKNITTAIIKPFGIGVEFDSKPGSLVERIVYETGSTVLGFLAKIAKQRNFVISNTPDGKLLFRTVVQNTTPVAIIKEAQCLDITARFNPQEYFSHISGYEPVFLGLEGSEYTVKNSKLTGVYRPHSFNVPDTQSADMPTAVNSKVGRMFANAVGYSIKLPTWRDPNGALWEPNTIINLEAPGVMIYNPYNFLVRNVSFSKSEEGQTATLNLIIPGTFSGLEPSSFPWNVG